MTDQEICGACDGSRRMPRDPDIGTDQECFVCDGSGVIAAHETKAAPAVPAWVQDVVIEYRYSGGTHWCPLGPAERAKVDFDGVYRLKPGTIPTESPTPAVPAQTFDEVWAAIDWNEWRMKPIRELIQMIHSKTTPAAPSQPVTLTEDEIDANTVWFDPDPHDNVHCDVYETVNKCIAALREKEQAK